MSKETDPNEQPEEEKKEEYKFPGFLLTEHIKNANWKDVPHLAIPHDYFEEICSQIDNVAELKIVLYIYRHTFGFAKDAEKSKHLTVEDFMIGRDSKNGRMDRGTGLSEMSVRNGIKKAVKHGYVVFEIKGNYKTYRLNVRYLDPGVQSLDPSEGKSNESENRVQDLDPRVQSLEGKQHNLDPKGTKSGPSNIERNQKETFKETKNKKGDQNSINEMNIPETPNPEERIPAFLSRLIRKYSIELGESSENIDKAIDLGARMYISFHVSESDFRDCALASIEYTKEIYGLQVKSREARVCFFNRLKSLLKLAQKVVAAPELIVESN